jgi:hypothetical protein
LGFFRYHQFIVITENSSAIRTAPFVSSLCLLFIRKIAEKNRYNLSFENIEKEQYLESIVKAAVDCDRSLLENILRICLKKGD